MRWRWVALWSVTLLVGAAFIKPISERVGWLAHLASFEVTHIIAHLFLYGSLTALALWAGLSAPVAAAVALTVATLQEGVQVVSVGRLPGAPEAFDILVDAVAVAGVLALARRRRSASGR